MYVMDAHNTHMLYIYVYYTVGSDQLQCIMTMVLGNINPHHVHVRMLFTLSRPTSYQPNLINLSYPMWQLGHGHACLKPIGSSQLIVSGKEFHLPCVIGQPSEEYPLRV